MIRKLLLIIGTIGLAYLAAYKTYSEKPGSDERPGKSIKSLFDFSGFENDSMRAIYFTLIDSANKHLDDYSNDSLEMIIYSAMHINDKQPESYYLLGRLNEKEKNYSDAMYYFDQALDKNKKHVESRLHKANALIKTEQYYEAEKIVRKLLDEGHNTYEAWLASGKIYFHQGYYYDAIIDLENALKQNQYGHEAYYYLAMTNEKSGQMDEAIIAINKALEVKADYAPALATKGRFIYTNDADYDEAINWYTKAINQDSSNSYTFVNRGLAFTQIGNINAALLDYQKALEINPQNYLAYNYRGYLYYTAKKYEEALNDLDICLSYSDFTKAYFNRGLVFYMLERYYEAIDDFTQVVYAQENNERALYNLALCYDAVNEDENALETWKQVMEISQIEQNRQYAAKRVLELNEKTGY